MKPKLAVLVGILLLVGLLALAVGRLARSAATGPRLGDTTTRAAANPVPAPAAAAATPAVTARPASTRTAASASQPSVDAARGLPAEPTENWASDVPASIPAGPLREGLLALAPAMRAPALAKLRELDVPPADYASLRVTADGQFYYAHDVPPPVAHTIAAPGRAAAGRGISAGAPNVAAASVPIVTPPVRHSRPGATNVLYLDFNGHTVTGTSWNNPPASATFVGQPYDLDSDPTTFNDEEQADIVAIWERVAEDYSPFDVDVTTEEPATFTSTTGRVLITSKLDANGVSMPSSSSGGVALLGVFGDSDYATKKSPAFVYYDNFYGVEANVAEAAAHEAGHNMGLSHDGTSGANAVEYYTGHGTGDTSWGPIMGTGYGRNVSQWSKGEYYLANNTQDDLAIIAARLGYRPDEAGASLGAAGAATVNGDAVTATGVVANSADVDIWGVTSAAGTISFAVAPYRAASGTHGGNTDLKLELLDAVGTVLASNQPADTTGASLTYAATGGTTNYFVRISGVGAGTPTASSPTGYTSYGSAGQYTLTGSIVAAAPAITSGTTATVAAGAWFAYTIVATNSPASYGATGLPAGLAIDPASGVISGRATVTGSFAVALSATNGLGTGTATLTLTVAAAAPAITSQSAGRIMVAPGAEQVLTVTALSANGTPTYQWLRNGRAIAGATGATLTLPAMTQGDSGTYRVQVTNTIGTTVSDAVFVRYAPTATETVVWGGGDSGATPVPTDLDDAVSLNLGYEFGLAARRDGTVSAWGRNSSGQTDVPTGLTEVVQVAAADFHALALKADGTVVAWGNDYYDQATVPSTLERVVEIASGGDFSLALQANGTVVAWGRNQYGQTDVPAGLTDVVGIAAGAFHALALKADGTVVAWGRNNKNQTTVPAGATDIVALSAGYEYSLARQRDGTIVSWGDSGFGQRTLPSGVTSLADVAAGSYHALGLKTDATVVAWGYNGEDQLAVPAGLGQIFAVDGGRYNSGVVRDATADAAPTISTQPAA